MRQLTLPLALLAFVFGVGIGWYALIEDFTLLEAIYQAVTTLSTVGFDEVQPLDTTGRVFTIVFILVGIGLMFYTATALVETVVAGEVREMLGRRRSGRKVQRMEQHVIVCGFGRVGREIAVDLHDHGVGLVVVDQSPDALVEAEEHGFTVVQGDATEELALRAAGVERARGLVAAADSDVENTYIALTGRALNPELFIVARAGSSAAEQRMKSAGANRVVSPYQIAGRRMALAIVQPLVLDFVDVLATRGTADDKILAEIVIDETSGFAGKTISEVFGSIDGMRLLGLENTEGGMVVGPPGATNLKLGDRLMVYGEQSALEGFASSGMAI
ncbi:MAG: potassium channel protein [Dehalococcoidia bacterium]|mgnify:FL=1|nr:potassium channel protein [Dehalococcoidia bacterium]